MSFIRTPLALFTLVFVAPPAVPKHVENIDPSRLAHPSERQKWFVGRKATSCCYKYQTSFSPLNSGSARGRRPALVNPPAPLPPLRPNASHLISDWSEGIGLPLMGIQLYFPTSEMRPACQRGRIWAAYQDGESKMKGRQKMKRERHLGLRAVNTFDCCCYWMNYLCL